MSSTKDTNVKKFLNILEILPQLRAIAVEQSFHNVIHCYPSKRNYSFYQSLLNLSKTVHAYESEYPNDLLEMLLIKNNFNLQQLYV